MHTYVCITPTSRDQDVRATIEDTDGALRHHRQFILSMSTTVHCYLRTLRREWGLTQGELASLLTKGSRNRISRTERGLTPPSADEIVAYELIFGLPTKAIFPGVHAQGTERVWRAARQLHKRLERDESALGASKREFLDGVLARAAGDGNAAKV